MVTLLSIVYSKLLDNTAGSFQGGVFQEDKPQGTSTNPASVCTFANVPLTKASHMTESSITGGGDCTRGYLSGSVAQWGPPMSQTTMWPLEMWLSVAAQESHIGLDGASLEN